MGYYLNAFLGRQDDLKKIVEKFRTSKVVPLTDQVALLPMTEKLFDEINDYRINDTIGSFDFLTADVEREILNTIDGGMVAYVEVEYFGGTGSQSGILWKEGKRIYEKELEQDVVNDILRQFGVVKEASKDEFDTVGLGRNRRTERWL
jgi:hypothetical protein